jgi:hypothetical protein
VYCRTVDAEQVGQVPGAPVSYMSVAAGRWAGVWDGFRKDQLGGGGAHRVINGLVEVGHYF